MAYAPENSALSMITAEDLGADEIEFDVRLSADGVPVIVHDADLARISGNADTRQVADLDWEQLKQVQLPQATRLLTLSEVLDLTHLPLQVEVKAAAAVPVMATVLAEHPDDLWRCRLTSFHPEILAECRTAIPRLPRGLIVSKYGADTEQLATEVEATAIYSGWEGLTPELVDHLHLRGFLVAGWPLRDAADATRAVELGVDWVTANDPVAAREWIAQAT
jgi:glycerophosphoryl diester phosphodiesterase